MTTANETIPTIAKLHTCCKNCVLATYSKPQCVTQVGCQINHINEYKQAGFEVLEVYDEAREFYVINNVKCMYYRDNNWAKMNQLETESNTENVIAAITKELEIKYQAIVIANKSSSDLERTLTSLVNQTIPPVHITVLRPLGSKDLYLRPRTITELLIKTGIPWRSENMVDPTKKIENHIDIIIDFEPRPHYSVFHAGFEVPRDTFSTLNELIIKGKNKHLALLANSTGNGFTTSHSVHILLQGNKDFPLLEKLQAHKKINKFLAPINEVIECFPK